MQDWSTPLILATAAFLGVLLWRVRPAFGPGRPPRREALREARARIESAPDDRARAIALCDAADALGPGLRRGANAWGFYLRAIRSDPHSAEVVKRASAGLSRRPRALESILWRQLAMAPWAGSSREATMAALDALRGLYDGPLRSPLRARALANALDALKTPPA